MLNTERLRIPVITDNFVDCENLYLLALKPWLNAGEEDSAFLYFGIREHAEDL
jgi:hypothetical protein